MTELKMYKDNGEMKTKEEFMADVASLYDDAVAANGEDAERMLKITTCNETQIDTKRTYETYNFLGKNFYITEEITQDMATEFYKFIEYWNDIDTPDNSDPITVYINSPGGDLEAALAIIATMEQSAIPVNTVVVGRAWSGAFLVSICGDHRTSLKYSSFLYHEGSAYYEADAHKYLQFSKYYENILLKNMETCILANTHIDASTYESHRKDDWWIDTKMALQYGIIDEIMEDAR